MARSGAPAVETTAAEYSAPARTKPGGARAAWALLRETFTAWNEHKAPKMGAALAYYTTFSLAPLLVIVVGVVSLVIKQDKARAEIVAQFSDLVGKEGGATVNTILSQAASQDTGLWATLIGLAVLLVGASAVFAELQDSLNTIWEVPARARDWSALIRDRIISFALVFTLGFLVLVSLLLSAGVAALGALMKDRVPGFDAVWEGANSLVLFAVVTLLFAALFRFLPDIKIAWRDVWTGAGLTAALFIVGKFLLGFYIGHSAFASAYGAAGSLIIVLVWVFYSAQIFFFGAEFTRAFARRHGSLCGKPPEVKNAA